MNKIIKIIFMTITNFFHYQQKFSKAWDRELTRLMDEDKNPVITEFTVCFNVDGKTYEVWVSNAFYSFGHIHRIDGMCVPYEFRRRPKASTMLRLAQIVGNYQDSIRLSELEQFKNITGFKSI